MKLPVSDSSSQAFTLRELVVSAALVGMLLTLAALVMPSVTCGPRRGQLVEVLSNMKNLYLATQQVTLDSQAGNIPPGLRWTCTNGQPLKFAAWTNLLVSSSYLTEKDLAKLLKCPQSNKSTNVFTVYAVGDFDPAETVLFATTNWLGPRATNLGNSPFRTPGFVIFRKGGDGAILQPRQCQRMDIIGSGGKFNFLPLQ